MLTKGRMVQTGLGRQMSRQTGRPGFGTKWTGPGWKEILYTEAWDLGEKRGVDRWPRSIQEWERGSYSNKRKDGEQGCRQTSPNFAQYTAVLNRSSLHGSNLS